MQWQCQREKFHSHPSSSAWISTVSEHAIPNRTPHVILTLCHICCARHVAERNPRLRPLDLLGRDLSWNKQLLYWTEGNEIMIQDWSQSGCLKTLLDPQACNGANCGQLLGG
jgi:hypothetical protein